MKFFILIFLFFHINCNSSQTWTEPKEKLSDTATIIVKKDTLPLVSQIPTKRTGNPKFYTQEDSVIIAAEEYDTLVYSKEKFNDIVDFFPELYDEYIGDPDYTYWHNKTYKDFINSDGEEKHIGFSSEVGRDTYYELYAYFLKQRTTDPKFEKRRKNLITIYRNINEIFGHLQSGGTYFGHQYRRILGYAEYSIYRYSQRNDDFIKNYDISKQKELYINSLKQIIKDEISDDNEIPSKYKKKSETELFKIVGKLDVLITDYFYLREARSFQYGYYNY
jgi:hypothetical protein